MTGYIPQEWLLILVLLVGMAFWLWMLTECASREPDGYSKIVWIIIISVTHFLGAALYFIVRRPKRIRQIGTVRSPEESG